MDPRNEPSSESLMARYQDRLDAAAFEELVSRFLAPALAVAQEILRDAALAEDAVQETFLRVVRCRSRYRRSMPFSTWFYAILRNVCTDMLRARTREAKLVGRIAAERSLWVQAPSFESLHAPRLLAMLQADWRTPAFLCRGYGAERLCGKLQRAVLLAAHRRRSMTFWPLWP